MLCETGLRCVTMESLKFFFFYIKHPTPFQKAAQWRSYKLSKLYKSNTYTVGLLKWFLLITVIIFLYDPQYEITMLLPGKSYTCMTHKGDHNDTKSYILWPLHVITMLPHQGVFSGLTPTPTSCPYLQHKGNTLKRLSQYHFLGWQVDRVQQILLDTPFKQRPTNYRFISTHYTSMQSVLTHSLAFTSKRLALP